MVKLLGVSFKVVWRWAKQMINQILLAEIKEEITEGVQIDEIKC